MNVKIKRNGTTRIVILTENYAIKIPNFLYCHRHFLQGCTSNWSERQQTKMFRYLQDAELIAIYLKIAPTLFCTWFGLLSVQKRCKPLTRDLTEEEKKYFKNTCTDIKKENFGWLNGRLVCVDYGQG